MQRALPIRKTTRKRTLPWTECSARSEACRIHKALEGVCELDESGYVKAGEDGSPPQRVFCGRRCPYHTSLRQVITALADGANALSSAEKYIMEL